MAVESGDAADLRERYDTVVVPTTDNCGKHLHIPDDEEQQPICRSTAHTGQWEAKDIGVFPPGYVDWCQHCIEVSES